MFNLSKPKKVLIVEDDIDLSNALKTILQKEGFDVLCAFDGKEGLDVVFTDKPDLVLLDLVMPRVSGVEFLAQFGESKRGKKVPVIVLTNLTHFTHLEQMYEKNISCYLVKTSSSLEDIVKKIRETIN